jgi:hypothetical protein
MASRRQFLRALAVAPLAASGGCALFGAMASKLPEPPVDAAYKGLANQPTAILVWADDGVRIDWPNIELDMANSVAGKLAEAQKAKEKALVGLTFPYRNDSMVRWTREHPGWAAVPLTENALKFPKVTRLIAVEFESFATRSAASTELYRGSAACTLRVVEINASDAKIGFEERSIAAIFPKGVPEEGIPNVNDRKIYPGTIDAAAFAVAKRFFKHSPDAT